MRNNIKFALILCTTAFIHAANVNAATTQDGGIITFTGEIGDATCEITGGDINNPSGTGRDFTVGLPKVTPAELAAPGNTAGRTAFFIKLSGANCADGNVANVRFKPINNTLDTTNGNLLNIAETEAAVNAQIRLLDNNNNHIDLNQAATTLGQTATVQNNSARFDYSAEYFAKAAVAPGKVTSNLRYDIEYN